MSQLNKDLGRLPAESEAPEWLIVPVYYLVQEASEIIGDDDVMILAVSNRLYQVINQDHSLTCGIGMIMAGQIAATLRLHCGLKEDGTPVQSARQGHVRPAVTIHLTRPADIADRNGRPQAGA
jgi:hypothetical protein